ncbi:MAG: TSUP family transporter, partial [Chitinophagales bacterium]|nr:TSUP family transporter [Chitinophagales bacterium]
MELPLILGYTGALLTGIVLGILGGGGALLSIPVLVYFFHIDADIATGYSLFLIGVTALSGAVRNIVKRNVDFRLAVFYGIPSLFAVYVMRRFLMPGL